RVVAEPEHGAHRLDALPAAQFDAEVEDVADFLVDDGFRQAEPRHLRAHEAATLLVGFEHGDFVAEWREIARDRQRGRARADAGDALAVLSRGRFWHARPDVALVVRCDALEPADGDGLGFFAIVFLDPTATAGRFAGSVAGASEDPRKDIRFPIDHVGIGVA